MAQVGYTGIGDMQRQQYPYTNNLMMNTPYDNYMGRSPMQPNFSTDITEMIRDASPEEKATLHQKMTTLANKIV